MENNAKPLIMYSLVSPLRRGVLSGHAVFLIVYSTALCRLVDRTADFYKNILTRFLTFGVKEFREVHYAIRLLFYLLVVAVNVQMLGLANE